jgi:peptide/nickel transport system substrate-binding protein
LGESDTVKRAALVKQIQKIVWDDAPYLFCVHGLNVRGLNPKVQGFVNAKEWQFQFQTMYKT